MKRITLVSETILKCRLHGIYRRMLHGDMNRAAHIIKDTLDVLRDAEEFDITPAQRSQFHATFQHMLVDIATHRYTDVHNRLRNTIYAHA
jgi:hypothetical protein